MRGEENYNMRVKLPRLTAVVGSDFTAYSWWNVWVNHYNLYFVTRLCLSSTTRCLLDGGLRYITRHAFAVSVVSSVVVLHYLAFNVP